MIMDTDLLLTDDEALSVALAAEASWRSPLPTVASSEAAGLTASAARGWRSLVVRRLVDDGQLSPELAELVRPVLSNDLLVRGFLAEGADFTPSPAGLTATVYADSADQVLVELVTPAGIHSIRRMRIADCAGLFVDTLTAAAEGIGKGRDDPSVSDCYAVLAENGRRATLIAARAGQVDRHDWEDGGPPSSATLPVESIGAEIDALLHG
jgi:hypothetical protein